MAASDSGMWRGFFDFDRAAGTVSIRRLKSISSTGRLSACERRCKQQPDHLAHLHIAVGVQLIKQPLHFLGGQVTLRAPWSSKGSTPSQGLLLGGRMSQRIAQL